MTDQPKRCRAIRLGSGHRLTLGDYVGLWRRVKSAADTGMRKVRCDLDHPFDHRSVLAPPAVLEQFRRGLHDRINRRGGCVSRGRKCDPDWQRAAIQAALFVNGDPRRAYHPVEWRWIPRELRRAFANREGDHD